MALLTTVRAHTRNTQTGNHRLSHTRHVEGVRERMCECARVRERSCIK